jgi:hypothetical protein
MSLLSWLWPSPPVLADDTRRAAAAPALPPLTEPEPSTSTPNVSIGYTPPVLPMGACCRRHQWNGSHEAWCRTLDPSHYPIGGGPCRPLITNPRDPWAWLNEGVRRG